MEYKTNGLISNLRDIRDPESFCCENPAIRKVAFSAFLSPEKYLAIHRLGLYINVDILLMKIYECSLAIKRVRSFEARRIISSNKSEIHNIFSLPR